MGKGQDFLADEDCRQAEEYFRDALEQKTGSTEAASGFAGACIFQDGEGFSYEAWCVDEPSRVDKDGTPGWYIMLWDIKSLGGWNWNGQRDDPAAAVTGMADEMGFICEYES